MPSYRCSFLGFLQSHYTVLLSSFLLPFSCTSWCRCSLPCISQFLQVQIISFSVVSFCRIDKEFLQWPGVFFWRCLPRISLAVSVTAVLKVVIIESRSVSSLSTMMRGEKLPIYHSLEGFQHIGIIQLFEVKLESCVFWLADSFQAKVEGLHQQVVVTCNVCSWKTPCPGNVHSWSEALPH